jgi:hypothetical protein
MSWKSRLAETFLRFLSSDDFREVAGPATVQMAGRMKQEEKLAFFRRFVEEHLGTLLAGLERAERAALMNTLLPTLAREFPLTDPSGLSPSGRSLDIQGAFSATGDPWAEGDEEA